MKSLNRFKTISEKQRIRPVTEVDRLLSDTLARKLINWSPSFKDREGLKLGLKKTIDWFMKKDNLKNIILKITIFKNG